MKKKVEITPERGVVFDDYPMNKYAKKIDWWTSDKGLELIGGWRRTGASLRDIYEKIGVDPRTFRSWRNKCPKLDEILSVGKEITNARVVDALYKRAIGFEYDEITRELVEGELQITKIVTKFVPPDTKAILSWLYNRYPGDWRCIQPPIDVSAKVLSNATDVLVAIRDAAESATEAHEDNLNNMDGTKGVVDVEAKENITESAGEAYASGAHQETS